MLESIGPEDKARVQECRRRGELPHLNPEVEARLLEMGVTTGREDVWLAEPGQLKISPKPGEPADIPLGLKPARVPPPTPLPRFGMPYDYQW